MFFDSSRSIAVAQTDQDPAAGDVAASLVHSVQSANPAGSPNTHVVLALEAVVSESVTISMYVHREVAIATDPVPGARFYLLESGVIVPGSTLVTRAIPHAGKVYARVTTNALAGTRNLYAAGVTMQKDAASPADLTAAVTTKANRRLLPRQITGTSGTLAQGDEDTGVETTNGSATSVTAPQLAVGTQIPLMQAGAGQITVVAGSGVTLRTPLGAKSLMQYTSLLLWWRSATEVWVMGTPAI